MAASRIVRYEGTPDEALAAFIRDTVTEQGWRPMSTSVFGQGLLVVWEKVDTDYTSTGVALLASLGAAVLFGFAGLQLIGLRSEAGNTVAEAFYQGVGWMSFGLAVLALAVGFRR